jgi:hypothetical protein
MAMIIPSLTQAFARNTISPLCENGAHSVVNTLLNSVLLPRKRVEKRMELMQKYNKPHDQMSYVFHDDGLGITIHTISMILLMVILIYVVEKFPLQTIGFLSVLLCILLALDWLIVNKEPVYHGNRPIWKATSGTNISNLLTQPPIDEDYQYQVFDASKNFFAQERQYYSSPFPY